MSATDIFNSESEYEAMVLENTARVIKTHRGDFYPDCDYGSDVYKTANEPKAL